MVLRRYYDSIMWSRDNRVLPKPQPQPQPRSPKGKQMCREHQQMRIKVPFAGPEHPCGLQAWRLPLLPGINRFLPLQEQVRVRCQVLCLGGKGFSNEQMGFKREERFSLGCSGAGSYELERADSDHLFPILRLVVFRLKLVLAGVFTSWKLVNTTKVWLPTHHPAQSWMLSIYQHTTRRGQETWAENMQHSLTLSWLWL